MSRRLQGNLSLASVVLFLLTTRICSSSSFFSFCLNCFCFILAARGDDVVQIFLWFPFFLFPVVFCLLLCCVAVQRIVFFSVHSQFLSLVVCVCVCVCSQWPRHCQILCCIFCILFFQRLYPDLSRISNSSVCGIHQLQIWKIPHQVDVNLELLFFFPFGKAFFICILLRLFCNSWVYSLYVAKCICTTDSWWQQSNIFLHVGGVQETLVLLGLLYVSIRLEIRKCFWKDLFQSRARDEWGEIAVGKTGGHCRWLGECKREWDLLCSWEISDNHNEQVEAAVGSTRQSNLCRLWSPRSQMGVCLSLSLSLCHHHKTSPNESLTLWHSQL